MNYIGSKLSLLPFIEQSIYDIIPSNDMIFCDLFSGTGIVATHFKKKNFTIYANDIQFYSFVLNKHFIENNSLLEFKGLNKVLPQLINIEISSRIYVICEYLENIKGCKGFIYNNYSLGGTKNSLYKRLYFTDENAMQCDAIRQKIEHWLNQTLITVEEYFYLLAILLESIDKVANTTSIYESFLKNLKKTAAKKIKLKPLEIVINTKNNRVFNHDCNHLIKFIKGDILYLDPPYNHRQYGTNYHILETIAKYDSPYIKGKTGIRVSNTYKSYYCYKTKAKNAFEELINNCDFKYIFLSYNDEGIISLKDIELIMSRKGRYGRFEKNYRRYKADKKRDYLKNTTVEYLHYTIVD